VVIAWVNEKCHQKIDQSCNLKPVFYQNWLSRWFCWVSWVHDFVLYIIEREGCIVQCRAAKSWCNDPPGLLYVRGQWRL
jgi:hypothetical protein